MNYFFITFPLFIGLLLFTSCSRSDQKKLAANDPFAVFGESRLSTCKTSARSLSKNQITSTLEQILGLYTEASTSPLAGPLDFVVDYQGIINSADSKQNLCDITNSLQSINLAALPAKERAAFIINIYNALSIQLVIENVEKLKGNVWEEGLSIINIEGRGDKIFSDIKWEFADGNFSFDDLESKALSAAGPLIHLVLHRSSVGFPSMINKLFTKDNLVQNLSLAAIFFVNDFTYSDLDSGAPNGPTASLHALVAEIFKGSFENQYNTLQEFLSSFVDSDETGVTAEELLQRNANQEYIWKVKSGSVFIDWSLNIKK